MAPESTALIATANSGSPYVLNSKQTLKASGALLKHIATKSQEIAASTSTKNLLVSDPVSLSSNSSDAEPIWLILTTKKFMTDHQQLKPRKLVIPNSFNLSPDASICLITPEPQRLFKNAIAHPSFPQELSKRITKIISVKKLEAKYHAYEAKRQLRDSYDIFLADDRIISYLAKTLGKTFYKTTPKRPIPVRLEASKPKEKKNAALPSEKKRKDPSSPTSIVSPILIAKEIERTLNTTQMHLHPSTTTSVKVGLASFTSEQIAANIEAVMAGVTEKLIAWKHLKAVHIKGPNTMALPIWLAEELWTDEAMVLDEQQVAEAEARKLIKHKKRRDMIEGPVVADGVNPAASQKRKAEGSEGEEHKGKKLRKVLDEDMTPEIRERREKLRQQKKDAREQAESEASKTEASQEEPSVKKKKKSRKGIEGTTVDP